MTAKHTPGSWHVSKFNDTKSWSIYAHDGTKSLASVRSECDAILIAAAPELLDALKEAVEFQNEDTDCLMSNMSLNMVMEGDGCVDKRCNAHGCMVARVNRWRAAIAKATGAAP